MQKHNPYVVSPTLETTPEAEELREFLESCYFPECSATTIQDIKDTITNEFHNLDDLLQRIVDEQTALTNLPHLSENARYAIIHNVDWVRQKLKAGFAKPRALQDFRRANALIKRIKDRSNSMLRAQKDGAGT